ncbi:MAG: hypothetical protein ACO3LE_01500 [Bdellovibrionota bacterium]
MKRLIGLFISCTLLLAIEPNLWAEDVNADDDLNSKIIIFTDEFEEFLERAWIIYESGERLRPKELEAQINQLMIITNRIAAAYFEAIDTEVQPEMESYFQTQYSRNSAIHHLFLLLGNSIHNRAVKLVDGEKAEHRQYKIWGVTGGALLGSVSAGAVLYFKPNFIPNPLVATLFVLGLGAAGTAAGWGGAIAAYSFILPANPAVKTAKDFLNLYPTGKDFIEDISEMNQDIELGLESISEALYAHAD